MSVCVCGGGGRGVYLYGLIGDIYVFIYKYLYTHLHTLVIGSWLWKLRSPKIFSQQAGDPRETMV